MRQHFNQLTAAEDERLALLLEELAEAIAAVGKIQRHGYESCDPTVPLVQAQTNRSCLEEELGHVQHALGLLINAGDVNARSVDEAHIEKAKRVREWLHHQDDKGENDDAKFERSLL